MKSMKDYSFDMKMKLALSNESEPWSLNDLDKVLKSLKSGKSRDPNGWVNEIFHPDVAGMDLRKSMLILFNKIK